MITGGYGITRELYQIEGTLNGVKGIFEWIVNSRKEYSVTHRVYPRIQNMRPIMMVAVT